MEASYTYTQEQQGRKVEYMKVKSYLCDLLKSAQDLIHRTSGYKRRIGVHSMKEKINVCRELERTCIKNATSNLEQSTKQVWPYKSYGRGSLRKTGKKDGLRNKSGKTL